MRELLAMMERHGLEPPGSMVLLSRTLLTLEGTLKVLDPGFELAPEAERIVARDQCADLGDPQATGPRTSSSGHSPRCGRCPTTSRRSQTSCAPAGWPCAPSAMPAGTVRWSSSGSTACSCSSPGGWEP